MRVGKHYLDHGNECIGPLDGKLENTKSRDGTINRRSWHTLQEDVFISPKRLQVKVLLSLNSSFVGIPLQE